MNVLATFHQAILDNDATHMTSLIKPHPRLSTAQQFAIYSEGYRTRLCEALEADYPALHNYLGNDSFRTLAHRYIEQTPPTSYSLDSYPYPFAAFLRAHHTDLFAHDLASLESAIAEVFYLPDSAPLAADTLSNLSPDAFSNTSLILRNAARLLICIHPVSDYLTAERAGEKPAKPQPQIQHLLIYRHNNEVQRLGLSDLSFALIKSLAEDKTIGQAIDALCAAYPDRTEEIAANLQSWFTQWMHDGIFTATN